jgi:hypothetical protein
MARYTGTLVHFCVLCVLVHSEGAVTQDFILDNLRTSLLNTRHAQCSNISLVCHNFILGPLIKIPLSLCLVKDRKVTEAAFNMQ